MVHKEPEITADDLMAALKDMKVYIDVTGEDLLKIYALALKHAKERLISNPPVEEAMTRHAITVKRDAGLEEAARLLSENNISGLPVVDDGGRVVGVVSEQDLLCMAGLNKGHSFKDRLKHILGEPLHSHGHGGKVEDIMSSPPITIKPATPLKEAARLMAEKRIKRLPVVDGSGLLLGIISRADIVKAMGSR